MTNDFVYSLPLTVPAGYDIPATIENIKRFFESSGKTGKTVLKECLEINILIPIRFVEKEVDVLKERICTVLLDPSEWQQKPLNIVIRAAEQSFGCFILELDENRIPKNLK